MTLERLLGLAAFLTGAAVVALSFVFLSLGLRSYEPLNGTYGDQAILAFELAQTPEQLAAVIGPNPPDDDAISIRRVMDQANRLDFAYMALYGLFIACACACVAVRRRQSWLLLGLLLGPLAAFFDLLENLVLLRLTETNADVATLLPALHWRTLAKWEVLALASALFAAAFAARGRPIVRALAAALVLFALAAGVLAIVDPARRLALLSTAIVIAWLWQLGYAATVMRRSRSV
jgi:hypothetical protein